MKTLETLDDLTTWTQKARDVATDDHQTRCELQDQWGRTAMEKIKELLTDPGLNGTHRRREVLFAVWRVCGDDMAETAVGILAQAMTDRILERQVVPEFEKLHRRETEFEQGKRSFFKKMSELRADCEWERSRVEKLEDRIEFLQQQLAGARALALRNENEAEKYRALKDLLAES